MADNPKGIVGSAYPVAKWFENAFGIAEPDPFETELDLLVEIAVKKSKLLNQRFPYLGLGSPDPEPVYPVTIVDARVVIASAYGAGDLVWRTDMGSYCIGGHPWADVSSVREILDIKVPNWDNEPWVQKMIARHAEMRMKTTYKVPEDASETGWLDYTVSYPYPPKRETITHFPSFIDLCPFLMGPENFFITLAADQELAKALLDKCFELSTSYVDYMRKAFDRKPITALGSFGGDNSCALSPSQYSQYAVEFDIRLAERYGNVPANLHSCGPSAHLYEVWAMYPHVDKIFSMQTRGIETEARRLRKALPNTILEITMHPPHFDFEHATPENIRRTMWDYAEQVGFRDLSLIAYFLEDTERVDRNTRTVHEVAEEINEHIRTMPE